MDNRLWLFYPENDIALARGTASFTPPAAAARLRRSGEVLPLWTGRDGDRFICSGVNDRWLDTMCRTFRLDVLPWDHTDFSLRPEPWGWSAASRRWFLESGFTPDSLPDDARLDAIRRLSHRRTALQVHSLLHRALPFDVWPEGVEITSPADLEARLRACPDSVVKAPWSSSGRGITFSSADRTDRILQQLCGTIARQGSVIVEPRARRITDLAMLFTYADGTARPEGLSVFLTDDKGSYHGNIVAPQQHLHDILSRHIDPAQLRAVADALPDALSAVLGHDYSGPVGVDMMIVRNPADDGTMLHPCVEVNLRHTMGMVALRLARFVDRPAMFTILPGDHTAECAYTASDGLLTSGRLPLNPPGADFTFLLEIR